MNHSNVSRMSREDTVIKTVPLPKIKRQNSNLIILWTISQTKQMIIKVTNLQEDIYLG